MLHFDLWHNGVNVACDAGTYLYYAMPPWNNGLATTEVHNTVVVDGVDQMERGPRFLWLRWTNGQKRHFQVGNRLAIFEGEHDGYGRLSEPVTHRRSVLQAEDIWVVIDDLVGEGAHEFALHWLLADLPFTVNPDRQHIALNTGTGNYNVWLHCCLTETEQTTLDTCRSSLKTVRGWQSLYYGTRQPALSVRLTAYGQVPCRFISVFAPAQVGSSLDVTAERVVWRTPEQELRVSLLKAGGASMITKAIWENGMSSEQLSILEDIKDK
jgi:asparagine synthase (glutamine-hydrolysing)